MGDHTTPRRQLRRFLRGMELAESAREAADSVVATAPELVRLAALLDELAALEKQREEIVARLREAFQPLGVDLDAHPSVVGCALRRLCGVA